MFSLAGYAELGPLMSPPMFDCQVLRQMSTDFPKRLPEKLRAIRERMSLSESQLAMKVKASDGDAIVSYESGHGDLPVSVLFEYLKVADVPIENLLDDDRELFSTNLSLRSF